MEYYLIIIMTEKEGLEYIHPGMMFQKIIKQEKLKRGN